jgi:hypothetical protein
MNSLPEMSDAAIASIMNNKVLVSDAAGMFKKQLRKNMKPYEESAVRTFNRIVDEWAENLLLSIGKDGYVQASLVSRAWAVYFEGTQTKSLEKLFGNNLLPEDVIRKTVSYLHETPVDVLISDIGLSAIQMVWGSLTQALRYETIHQKRLRVFSAGDNARVNAKDWFSDANMNMRLMKGDETPFNIPMEIFMDIGEKVQIMNQCVPKPTVDTNNDKTVFTLSEAAQLYRAKIPKNAPKYERDARTAYNAIVKKWDSEMLVNLPEYSTKEYHIRDIMKIWSCYFEGVNTHFVPKNSERILCLSDEALADKIKFLSNNDVSTLIRDHGSTGVDITWFMITTTVRCSLLRMKRDAIFSQSTNPVEWWRLWEENSKIVNGDVRPFDIAVEDFTDMGEKVLTILSNAPEVATPRSEE